jgi:hypothetical protein
MIRIEMSTIRGEEEVDLTVRRSGSGEEGSMMDSIEKRMGVSGRETWFETKEEAEAVGIWHLRVRAKPPSAIGVAVKVLIVSN